MITELQNKLNSAIETENYELAAEIRNEITQKIDNVENDTNGANWRDNLKQAYGEVQAVVPQLVTPENDLMLPPTHHKTIFYRQFENDDWCESKQACKDYQPHTLEDIEETIDAIGKHIDLNGCDFSFGWSGGERIKIRGFSSQVELQDDSILPIIDLSAGYDLTCPYRLSFGQDVFKCSNGLIIVKGKLAAGSSKKHSKNVRENILDLVKDFEIEFEKYTQTAEVFKRMSETELPNWRETVNRLVGGNDQDSSTQKRNRYSAICARIEKESQGIKVTNWRVAQGIHGYFQHEHKTTQKMNSNSHKADWANNRPEVAKAFELLAV